ncbi:hypothetical protein AC1031_005949 [Aphanomyces cochlioides]|nr:hypothetical protein AC1031_005949 [Aphanomyces cochlioides]
MSVSTKFRPRRPRLYPWSHRPHCQAISVHHCALLVIFLIISNILTLTDINHTNSSDPNYSICLLDLPTIDAVMFDPTTSGRRLANSTIILSAICTKRWGLEPFGLAALTELLQIS